MSLKSLIWSLTDFEFLASITSVDFRNHRVIIAPEFFNYLVGRTREHFNAHSKYEIISIVTFLRRIYFTRLGLVSPHSMRRWFDRDLNVKYLLTKFFWKVNRHFSNLEKDNNFTKMLNQRKMEEKKKKRNDKKKQQRMRRRLAKQQQDQQPTQQPIEEQPHLEEEENETEHSSKDDNSDSITLDQEVQKSDEEQSESSEIVEQPDILSEAPQNNEIVRTKASEYDINNEDDFNAYWDLIELTSGLTFDVDNDWDFITQLLLGGISPVDIKSIQDEVSMRERLIRIATQSEDEY